MPDRLGDVSGDRVEAVCTSCRRTGSYRVAGLLTRYGPGIPLADLLRHLTAACRHQRAPGAPARASYHGACLAVLRYAKPPSLEPPVPPGTPFVIEVWDARGRVEARLAVIYPIGAAIAAYEAACADRPGETITLRQKIRVVRQQGVEPA